MKKVKFYLAPEINVEAVETRQVICQSQEGDSNKMHWSDEDASNWH